jgi:hypothetical protein
MSEFGIGNFQSDEACELLREVVQKQFINLAFAKIDDTYGKLDSFPEFETMALLEAAIILLEKVGSPAIDVNVVEAYREKALSKWDVMCAELWADEIALFRRKTVEVTFDRLALMVRKDDHWR